jgi:protein-S-isoprenylcysteine O-methyltransferase Ste14
MSAEHSVRAWMFKYRSYTPLPFLVAMVIFARPTILSLCVGLAVVILGEAIRFWGVSIAGSETRTTGSVGGTYLITTGPFSYVRNPLYVGNILLYSGVGIMSMALFPWLLLGALVWFVVQYTLIVLQEEEYLAERFGEAYATYRKNVHRFLPRLTPYRDQSPAPKSVNIAEGFASERRTLQAITLVILLLVVIYVWHYWSM